MRLLELTCHFVPAVDGLDPDPFDSLDTAAGPASLFRSSANKH